MSYLSFKLSDEFVEGYADRKPRFGFPIGGGNTLGELTFYSKYSRQKDDGSKERWHESCQRVIEGMYSILKDHCKANRTPWNENKAQRSAQEAYDRMFAFKWLPPGRGLQMMGTPLVNEELNPGPLYNCAFLSTSKLSVHSEYEATLPFTRLMDMSMHGIGVGFDVEGAGKITLHEPTEEEWTFVVPDSREGWVESLHHLLVSYFFKNRPTVRFDYSQIRPPGSPIVRFGGKAPGPEPLRKAHEKIRSLLSGREGELLGELDILDINNLTGKAVVAGGVRRSAEIGIGPLDSPEFLGAKDWRKHPERMGADGWGNLSNNTVINDGRGDILNVLETIALNGEPGIFNRDLARRYGRLIDPPNDRDHRVMGLNPCVTGDTWVMTAGGPRRAVELVGVHTIVQVDGKNYTSPEGFFQTGVKDVYALSTREGYTVNLTADHRVLLGEGQWVEAKDLREGDQIVLHNHERAPWWDGPGTEEAGYIVGSFLGDGTWEHGGARICSWGESAGDRGVRARIQKIMDARWRSQASGAYFLHDHFIVEKYLEHGSKKVITDTMQTASSAFNAGLLRGLFDTDGHVEGSSVAGGISIRLSQSDLQFLEDVQRILLRMGIRSKINKAREAGQKDLPDGRGGMKAYPVKPQWRLIISSDCDRFMQYVGFHNTDKTEKYVRVRAEMKRGFYAKPFTVTFESLESLGEQEVYDITVPEVHAFDANGLYVHNCGEITLESHELCNLTETFPDLADDLEDFKRTMKFAYLYSKAVTLMPTSWPETNEVLTRNRRIGTSMAGVAMAIEKIGWSGMREWADAGYREICSWDEVYSEWLGVRTSIKMTSGKPGGSVPILPGQTPGVGRPVKRGQYCRRQRFGVHEPYISHFKKAGYHVEPDVMDPEFSVVVEFPTEGPDIRDETEVSVWEKTALSVLMQRYWADNSISCTISFMPDEVDQLGPVIKCNEDQLKTISFLPIDTNTYEQMPYEAVTPKKFEAMRKKAKPIDWDALYAKGPDVQQEMYCDGDKCEIPQREPVLV